VICLAWIIFMTSVISISYHKDEDWEAFNSSTSNDKLKTS